MADLYVTFFNPVEGPGERVTLGPFSAVHAVYAQVRAEVIYSDTIEGKIYCDPIADVVCHPEEGVVGFMLEDGRMFADYLVHPE